MKNNYLIILFLCLLLGLSTKAQGHFTERDTIDVLHYNICLDMGHHQSRHIQGWCEVTLRMLQPATEVSLGLMAADIDSIQVNGTRITDSTFRYNRQELHIPVGNANINDTIHLKVHYGSFGWVGTDGGFWCEDNLYYNLGEDRLTRPFSMGRSWFPCKDSVYDRATYSFHITVPQNWTAICSGEQINVVTNADSSLTYHYELRHPITTYQAGINAAPYSTVIQFEVEGQDSTYPVQVATFTIDSSEVMQQFRVLEPTLKLYERLFGPYRWDNIRFSEGGPNCGMEHVNNICFSIDSPSPRITYLIDHEFAHQWFGNLVTCDRLEDMWFNEGGATFADRLATENRHYDKWYARDYKQTAVINAPHYEHGYHPLCGMPNEYSFQTTTYRKGSIVFQELRQLLGDSAFFAMIRTLLHNNAYTNMDSYQLRDSMSLYSGVDLTDFYNFHIFGTGFASYLIDSIQTTDGAAHIWLSQHLWHATDYCHAARVPVTFFSEQGDTMTCQVMSTGRYSEGEFHLPFTPAFALVDYYAQTAHSSFSDELTLYSTEKQEASYGQIIVEPTGINDTVNMFMNLTLCNPEEDLRPGLIRWSHRRWYINGDFDNSFKAKVKFRFGNDYPIYDNEFLLSYNTKDSIQLFYRKDASSPWIIRETATMGFDESFMGRTYYMQIKGTPLKGEYIMAVVDTALLDINEDGELREASARPKLSLSPNPANSYVDVAFNSNNIAPDACNISIMNVSGKRIMSFHPMKSTTRITTESWPAGFYFITITSPSGATTKKLIIQ